MIDINLEKLHPLLARQVRRALKACDINSQGNDCFDLDYLIQGVNLAYEDFDGQRKRLERALDLTTSDYEDMAKSLEMQSLHKLEESEKRYRQLYESSSDAVFIRDKSGFVDCNSAALEMFGYSDKESFLETDLMDLQPEIQPSGQYTKDLILQYSHDVIKNGMTQFDWIYRRKNGETFNADVVLKVFKIGDKKFILCVSRDITKRKELEKTLIEAKEHAEKQSQSKSDFLANMSHEIRTPINAISGLGELLGDTKLNDKQKNMLHELRKSTSFLLNVLNDILTFSSLEAGEVVLKPAPVVMEDFIRDIELIVRPMASSKNLKFYINSNERLKSYTYMFDAHKLKQVLLNLINNAIKFTNEGSVHLSFSCENLKNNTTNLCFKVSDTGDGITKESQEKLFQSFEQVDVSFSKKHQGTGLGLAICKNFIDIMGGDIHVESTPQKGSVFSFTINVPSHKTVQKSKKPIKKAVTSLDQLKGRRVLLVEDNKVNQMVAKGYLSKVGCVTDIANDGQEAVNKIVHNKKHYDVILMDLHMPVMDGYEATQKLVSYFKDCNISIPIIAVTANVMEREIRKCFELGMSDYVSKPIDSKKFYEALEHWISNIEEHNSETLKHTSSKKQRGNDL